MSTTSTVVITNNKDDAVSSLPINLDNSYKGDEIGKKCCEILGLDSAQGWSVVDYDEEEQLALLHYREDADKMLYGYIRGLFIDLETNSIIADSFGYTPTLVSQEIELVNNSLVLRDSEGNTHTFSKDEAIIKRVFEGVVIRVIWRKGKMYKITHRKINTNKSRWGSSKSFMKMYEEAGGPTEEQLFDISVPNSSTCYDFLVVDRSLLVATRQVVESPYLVCIAKREMKILRPDSEVAIGVANFETTEEIKGNACGPFIHSPKYLSIDDANFHLKYGYYRPHNPDNFRQLTGEAIIIYKMDGNKIVDSVKVHSPSYDWRVAMRGNDPNVYHRFYKLLTIVYPEVKTVESWDKLKDKLMIFPMYEEQSIRDLRKSRGYIFTIPTKEMKPEDFSSREDRIYLLWINYLMSLPMHVQEEALDILNKYNQDKKDLVIWLKKIEKHNKDLNDVVVSDRAKALITSSRFLAKGKTEKYPHQAVGNTIRNLISKEDGQSLYGLIRNMKQETKKALQNSNIIPGSTLEDIEGQILVSDN